MIELSPFFKSIIEQDNTSIVVCNTEHEIIYMNPTACKYYEKRGGGSLVGKSLLPCHNEETQEIIKKVVSWFAASKDNNRVHSFYIEKQNKDGYMIALRDENGDLIGYYEKHEYRTKDETPFYDMGAE